MRIDVLTLFPEMCRAVLSAGVLGRAIERGIVRVVVTDFRRFADDRHGTVDDAPYGGGAGMVLRPEPVVRAVETIRMSGAPVISTSPAGETFTQGIAEELGAQRQLVFLCGRYKGFDERVRELVVSRELSLGDYVLSGGELAALVMVDAIVRRLPGALGNRDSAETDSFGARRGGGLDSVYYTRPPSYRGLEVPATLRSGDHGAIEAERRRDSIERTRARRPDLVDSSAAPQDGRRRKERS